MGRQVVGRGDGAGCPLLYVGPPCVRAPHSPSAACTGGNEPSPEQGLGKPGLAREGWTGLNSRKVQKPVKTCFLPLMHQRTLGVRGQDRLSSTS